MWKKPSFWLVLTLVLASVASPAKAAEGSNKGKITTAFAVVDVERILHDSAAAKSVQKQLTILRSKFQTEIEREENELRQAEHALGKSREQLTADVYAEREQQLRQRFLSVERHVQARRGVLEKAYADSMNIVRTNILSIVETIAHEHEASLVLVKQQTLWSNKELDVTDEVLSRLNQKLSQVNVKLPSDDKP